VKIADRASIRSPHWAAMLALSICASLGTLVAQQDGGERQRPRYIAAASLYSHEQVTVVYPAGPGDDVSTNRFSAERRAAFLQGQHGIASEIAADDAVTAKQLAGNLLLLGWSNRLLALHDLPDPIKPGPPRQFLDIVLRPGREVIYGADSPFQPDSRLTFWSRIDPELDRFSILPFTGSDWAVLTDDTVLLAGMFEKLTDTPWPPARNLDGEIDHRNAGRGARPRLSKSSAHYSVYDRSRSLAASEIEAAVEARERAYERVVAALGSPGDDFRIELHLYRDEEGKRRECGVSDPMHSVPRKRELHMIQTLAKSNSPHEDVHLVAYELFGMTLSTALYEGLAISVEPAGLGQERAMNAAAMIKSDYIPDLAALLDEGEFRVLTQRGSGSPSAMQFVAWLRETTDAATFGKIYSMARPSAASLAQILGKTEAELQQAFASRLAELAQQGETPLAYRAGVDTGRKRASEGDHAAAAEAWQRALDAQPNDLLALHGLALAHLHLQQFQPAQDALTRLLDMTEQVGNERYRSFALYQLGRLNDLRGKRKAALRLYRAALEADDYNRAHERSRAAIASPETIRGLPGFKSGDTDD